MKVQRARRSAATGRRTGTSGQRVLMAEAALAGGLVLALLLWELPSLRREARIWRMAGGFRAGRRYP
ncbi:hypothetical protein [Streptomyces caeruleatus]|uniref:Uncharacterized protein n=1 Tax=Streptomyces caeruleatus TaxID=661399 RepID=A0A101U6L9_9ACTN|nr:hypothetical protein [Streptomyces caeruleatus]KUO05156.1 hypothetical protein AQJ67_07135 [Streptomyces caeruleatus]